jgi:hypothetical protein
MSKRTAWALAVIFLGVAAFDAARGSRWLSVLCAVVSMQLAAYAVLRAPGGKAT